MREIVISKNEAGQRLNKLVMKYLNKAPSSFVYRMIRKKNIKLNGGKAVGNEIVYVGDVIQLYLADDTIDSFRDDNIQTAASGSQKKFKPEIIYHDHNVLIVNKPVGVLSQKASKDRLSINESVLDYLLDNGYITSAQLRTYKPSICNRLDRNTSGLVLCGVSLMGKPGIIQDNKGEKYRQILLHHCKGTHKVGSGRYGISCKGREKEYSYRERRCGRDKAGFWKE